MAVAVALFTVLAVTVVWVQSLRLQSQLRDQLLSDAGLRARQLSVALAGQTSAFERLADRLLRDLRVQWLADPGQFSQAADQALQTLPAGMVTHVAVVDAQGTVIMDAPGELVPRSMADRQHFQAMRSGGDRLLYGEPVRSRRNNGQWVMALGRPLFRDGRFDGAIYLLIPTDYVAGVLGRLTPSNDDMVALIHPSGRFLAHHPHNGAAMGQQVPPSRPFMLDRARPNGTFTTDSAVDDQRRVFGWHRLEPSAMVVVVGLSEAGVLAPLAASSRQAQQLALLLSVLLGAVGVWIGRLLWRLQQDQRLLDRSRERLRESQRIARLGHWTMDADRQHMHWSEQIYRVLGLDAAGGASYRRYWELVPEDERPRLRALMDDVHADRSERDLTHRIVRPDGSHGFVQLIVQRVPEEVGLVWRGTLQDVTELRNAQLALQGLNRGLERRVKARTAELQALNRELESFTYSVSHDLRTPLRSIQGFASLLQDSEGTRLSPDGRDFVRRIQDSSQRMSQLIADLLSMAQHSRADIRPQPVDLSALARQIAADLERGDAKRRVQWDIQPDLWVQADPTLMHVVLQNLLGNAWKYTARTAEARISLTATTSAEGQTGFCVRDNGAGFDMAHVGQLFQPFKRLHALTDFEGTGIGLATVARVVQRHGGHVQAEGSVGQGACFCFTLPLQPVRPFADSVPPPA